MLLDALQLPSELVWVDRDSYQPILQTQKRTLTGALVVQNFPQISGRPVTLSTKLNGDFIKGSDLVILEAIRSSNLPMVLTLNDSTTMNVIFDQDKRGLSAIEALTQRNNPNGDTIYRIQIFLIETL